MSDLSYLKFIFNVLKFSFHLIKYFSKLLKLCYDLAKKLAIIMLFYLKSLFISALIFFRITVYFFIFFFKILFKNDEIIVYEKEKTNNQSNELNQNNIENLNKKAGNFTLNRPFF